MDDKVATLHRDNERLESMCVALGKVIDAVWGAAEVEQGRLEEEIAQLRYENARLKKQLVG